MKSLLSLPTETSLYKTQYRYFLRLPKNSISLARKKQEIWRQKQIYIYYTSGRPLFGGYKSDYNPSLYKF